MTENFRTRGATALKVLLFIWLLIVSAGLTANGFVLRNMRAAQNAEGLDKRLFELSARLAAVESEHSAAQPVGMPINAASQAELAALSEKLDAAIAMATAAQAQEDVTVQGLETRLSALESEKQRALEKQREEIAARQKNETSARGASSARRETSAPLMRDSEDLLMRPSLATGAPFRVVDVESRGGERFLSILPHGANPTGEDGIQFLRIGGQFQGWALASIEARSALFNVGGQLRRVALP
jgi:hypothetical protein